MSRKYYYAAFMPAEEGGYDIVVPDLPEVASCCESLEQGSALTVEALEMILRDRADNDSEIPEPSCLEDIQAKTLEHLKEIEHEPAGEIVYKRIPVTCRLNEPDEPKDDPEEVQISVSSKLAEEIERKAREADMSKIEFLALAVASYNPQPSEDGG